MENLIYQAVNSAQTNLNRQTVTGGNLASTEKIGFRADIFKATTLYKDDNDKHDHPFVGEEDPLCDFTPGSLIVTGNPLDIAIDGKGWFAVSDPSGKEAYTRAGNLKIDENGLLTSNNLPILGDGGPISIPPFQQIEIGNDGTISIVPLDGQPGELAVLDRIKIVNVENRDLVKGPDGLLHLKGGAKAVSDESLRLVSGSLEGSNVNPVNEMVNLIEAGRDFETQMKLLQDISDAHKKLAQFMQIE